MNVRGRAVIAALTVGLVATGLSVEAAQTATASSRRCAAAVVPKPITAGQTSTTQAQVRWAAGARVAKYRLHYSPAPYGTWPGYDPHTIWYAKSARLGGVNLPAPGPGDRYLSGNYGNPVYAQLQVNNGCNSKVKQSPWFPVWARAKSPGNASTGDALAFGSYNVELFPTGQTTKMKNLKDNIATHKLDVVVLQEATPTTARDLATLLGPVWKVASGGNDRSVNQQILFRSDKYAQAASGRFGQRDTDASTPLPTPWADLKPVAAGSQHSSIFVVAVHLEESSSKSVLVKKTAAHNAALAVLKGIKDNNTSGLPTLAAGDFKGNFQTYCDEKSRPACAPDGQPTFIRAGFLDAQAAVSKVGVAWATVNKHVANQPANKSGFGGRADFIVVKGFSGVARYEVVHKTYGNGSASQQSDHNLIFANLFIPFV